MKRSHLAAAALVLAAFAAAGAQDKPPKTSLKLPTKSSVIADAAERGDIDAVRKAIARGEDVNIPQGDGMTALHWAADHADTAMTSLLLKSKANVKAVTRIGAFTPLHIASKSGNATVVRALLAAGSDAKAVTNSGASATHFAAAAGNADALDALIDKGADVNAREPEWGQTPLVFAAEFNRPAAIRELIKRGADPSVHTAVVNVTEQTAREQAAKRKRDEILISFEPPARRDSADAEAKAAAAAAAANGGGGGRRGGGGGARGAGAEPDSAAALGLPAKPPARTRAPRGPFTPAQIQAAIDSGRAVYLAQAAASGPVKEEVDTLNGGVSGFLGQVGGIGGLTPLHHAVRQGNVAAVVALLEGGAKINDTNYVDRTTPLLEAAINGQFDVAMKLLEKGADPNFADKRGMTPLYAAINTEWAPKSRYPQPQAVQNQKTGYLELMEALLKAGANPNARITQQPWYFAYNNCGNANCGLENIEGTTAFWRASYSVDVEAMRLLVKYKADPNIASQRAPQPAGGRGGRGGGGGGGGGGAAGGRGFGGPPQLALLPEVDSAMKLVVPGTGVLPIHAAAGVGYGTGYAGNSHRHATDGWMPAMKYLVEELHADVNARDLNGYTPLHHAAARGDNDMILYLVAHGADVKAVSRRGQTVVDMANGPVSRLRPFPETIALLEKLGAKNQHHCASC